MGHGNVWDYDYVRDAYVRDGDFLTGGQMSQEQMSKISGVLCRRGT